jgi:fucose 4-O-acetylase-like acetyltransferase
MEKRYEWIDALKGWGMLLIVVGHIWSLSELSAFYIWIFAFQVQILIAD